MRTPGFEPGASTVPPLEHNAFWRIIPIRQGSITFYVLFYKLSVLPLRKGLQYIKTKTSRSHSCSRPQVLYLFPRDGLWITHLTAISSSDYGERLERTSGFFTGISINRVLVIRRPLMCSINFRGYCGTEGFSLISHNYIGGPSGNRIRLFFCLQGRRPPHAVPRPIYGWRSGTIDYHYSPLVGAFLPL